MFAAIYFCKRHMEFLMTCLTVFAAWIFFCDYIRDLKYYCTVLQENENKTYNTDKTIKRFFQTQDKDQTFLSK